MEIDYASAWTFVDEDGRPRQLRFRPNWAPLGDPRSFDGRGQLIAAAVDGTDVDELAISRPDVWRAEVETVLEGWQDWAASVVTGVHRVINLVAIRRRLLVAGLGAPLSMNAKR